VDQKKLPPTESLLNIHQKIIGIMSELDYIAKGDTKVNGQYKFVSHDQVTAKIHPLLVKYGVTIIPTVEEVSQEGNRTLVKLVISFINADCPTDLFAVRFVGAGIDPGDKGIGKAISYAYKYALLKTFCLETGDDPDNDAKAVYEAPKCDEFEAALPSGLSTKDEQKIIKFLQERSKLLGKHVEDIKREAVKRMPEFMAAVKKWKKDE
jgi:ERF superfamily